MDGSRNTTLTTERGREEAILWMLTYLTLPYSGIHT